MKLIDNTGDKQLSIGDTIRDDNGTLWFILGFSSQGWVQVVENDKLATIAQNYGADVFDLRIEV